MNKLAWFMIIFVVVMTIVTYAVNVDRSDFSVKDSAAIVDEAPGEDFNKEIEEYINDQVDSFS